jgi:hypothetical protein
LEQEALHRKLYPEGRAADEEFEQRQRQRQQRKATAALTAGTPGSVSIPRVVDATEKGKKDVVTSLGK